MGFIVNVCAVLTDASASPHPSGVPNDPNDGGGGGTVGDSAVKGLWTSVPGKLGVYIEGKGYEGVLTTCEGLKGDIGPRRVFIDSVEEGGGGVEGEG